MPCLRRDLLSASALDLTWLERCANIPSSYSLMRSSVVMDMPPRSQNFQWPADTAARIVVTACCRNTEDSTPRGSAEENVD